jgi:transcriptional regulator with XRE-family HTH domain/DNA-binding CsgD family transcriptional regulator
VERYDAADEHGSISKLLGQRLRGLRTARGLSQDALAEAVGTRARMLSKIESGQSSVSLERLYALAQALEVEPQELLPGSHEVSQPPIDELGRAEPSVEMRLVVRPRRPDHTIRTQTDPQPEHQPVNLLAAIFLDDRGEVLVVGPSAAALLNATRKMLVLGRQIHCDDPRVSQWLQRTPNVAEHPCCWLQEEGSAALRIEFAACPERLPTWAPVHGASSQILLLERRTLIGGLSASLCEVAELLAEGCSDKDIARRTKRPLTTVRTYVARLYVRSGLHSRAAVAKWWWTSQEAGVPIP